MTNSTGSTAAAQCPGRLRARAEINSHFGASAGRADARRRDAGDAGAHRRGAATKPISALAAAPLRAAARRPAGFVARSSRTPGTARRSRLASGPGGLQQNVKLFLREPLACCIDSIHISYLTEMCDR